jgi:hypothetical protein
MLACAAVARSRYFMPGNVVAILRDPVVTSSENRLRFESFSSCCGVHARLDLLPAALAEPPVASGSTNVDFNDAMRAALAGSAVSGPLLLSVGSGELLVDTFGGSVTERKVPLPDRWLKGFGEVQALARRMRPIGELTGTAARRFVRSIPRAARRPLWVVPAGGTFSSAEADTRIAAAQLWSCACADGRLDPALAAAALVTGVSGQALKLSRITDALQHASHTAQAARRIVETVCAGAAGPSAAPRPACTC